MSKRSGRRVTVSGVAGILAGVLIMPLLPGVASAASFLLAGFGDSLTQNSPLVGDIDGSYLGWLPVFCPLSPGCAAFLPGLSGLASPGVAIPGVFDGGVSNDPSGAIEARLNIFLAGNTATSVVIMAGTVDAYGAFNLDATRDNIEDMIRAVATTGALPLVIAPPPVVDPCDINPPDPLVCAAVNTNLSMLRGAIEGLPVLDPTVPPFVFVDAFNDFLALGTPPGTPPPPASLYLSDGLHLFFGDGTLGGDQVIAGGVVAAIPEPGTGALVGLGLLGLALRQRVRQSV